MLKKPHSDIEVDLASLAEKIRGRRKELKLTLNDVAEGAGLSVGFISQVERNITAPSLGSLATIASVLKLPINALLDSPTSGEEINRRDRRSEFTVPGSEVSYERLSSSFSGSTLHSVIVHEPPGHRQEPISHQGEEMIFVLNGEITVEIDGETSIMKKSDSIHFDSRRVHSVWNHLDETVSILWCGTMDVFGDENPQPIHKKTN